MASVGAWLAEAFEGCGDADCRVRAVADRYNATHRVVLFPQAFFVAGDDPHIVCYDADPAVFSARLAAALAAVCAPLLPGCPRTTRKRNASPDDPLLFDEPPQLNPTASWISQLYPEDSALWLRHCGETASTHSSADHARSL